MTPILYGIPNCDTVKKARAWLGQHGVEHTFHDYKKSGITAGQLKRWSDEAGWETILNRAGTTFRKLSDADKANLDQARAIALMVTQPSMIKRPIVEHAGGLLVGFRAAEWETVLG